MLAAAGMAGPMTARCAAQGSQPAGELNAVERRPVASASQPAEGTSPENRPVRTDGPDTLGDWGRTALALGVVVAIIFLLRWAARKFGGRRALPGRPGTIEVLARASLQPRQHLLLVRLGRRLILLGASPNAVSTLAEITDPEEVAELTEAAAGGGTRWLKAIQKPEPKSSAPGKEAKP